MTAIAVTQTKGVQMDSDMEWWGYSALHGWVVLDRTVLCNAPGLKVPLEFVRASDMTVYMEPRDKWVPPHYRFATNYLKDLKADDAAAAAAELEVFKAVWPDTRGRLGVERKAAAVRIEAARLEAEQARKAGARKKKERTDQEPPAGGQAAEPT